MSPLLGSTGGSSEYAFRGTLDDWPNDFAAALAAQNPSVPINPTTTITATLTITGLNYKARVIANHPNVTVAVTSEFGVAVTDGREVYAARKASDPPLLIRDQSVVSIRLQPTSGTINDFLKTYVIPVTIGKRIGIWTVSTEAIDETPTSFIFNPLTNQELGITTTSNIITIAGLENGFDFPISVVANQVGGNVSYFKNGIEFIAPSTVVNGDQIYLSTLTPSLYSTPRTFTVQVGTFTTSWGILTRDAVTTIDPFSFTGIASANQLGFGYTSGFMTISGADAGPASTDPATWPTDPTAILVTRTGIGSFQILKSDNTLRYTDPANPAAPNYWQFGPTYAFNGDKINLKVPSSLSYNTTTSTTLNVSDKSGTFDVTTRVAPIDTVPQDLTDAFGDLTGQARGSTIQSNEITLSSMSPAAATGTASISAAAGITPQFNVNGSATWISPPTTAAVKNGDTIRLRMTTTNPDGSNGSTNNNIVLRVDGIDTTINTATPPENPEGFTTLNLSQSDTWTVETIPRNCTITAPTNTDNTYGLGPITGVQTNTSVSTNITFPSPNWNNDCRMRIRTNVGGFTAKNGITISPANTELANVLPTDTVTLTITSSPDFLTETLTTITLTNDTTVDPTITPKDTKTVTWSVRTTANTSPATLNLSIASVPPSSSVEVGGTFILSWSSNNCTSIKDTQGTGGWTPAPSSTNLNGSVALVGPSTAGTYTYILRAYVNSNASNVTDGTITTQDAGGYYIASNTITMTVTDDTSPVFTEPGNPANSNFTTQLNVAPTTDASFPVYYTSNVLRVSSLSVKLSASIDTASDPGAAMIINGGTPSVSAVGTIGVGTDVQLRIAAAQVSTTDPTGYDTPTTATIRFFSGAVEVANKTFTARTRVCTPFESSIQFPTSPAPRAGDEASSITLDYYSGYSWTSTTSGTPITTTTEALLKNRVGTAASTASAYYRSTLTANGDPVPPALGAYNSRFADSQDTEVEWQELIDVIWNTHIELLQRPPTRNFIETAINGIVPSTYANLSSTKTFIVALIGTSAIRNTTTPIVNLPCRTTIKSGAYTLSGGNYV